MTQTRGDSLRDVVVQAIDEASARGAVTVEAEHLLLALVADPSLPAARVLAEVGWDRAGVEASLDDERTRSLAVAGIAPPPQERLAAAPRTARPGWGASAKAAIRNAGLGVARHGTPSSLLLGILAAQNGTVPRALAFAGIDRDAVVARLRGAAA